MAALPRASLVRTTQVGALRKDRSSARRRALHGYTCRSTMSRHTSSSSTSFNSGSGFAPPFSRKQSKLRVADEEVVIGIAASEDIEDGNKGKTSPGKSPPPQKSTGRLWSNVEPETMRHQPGSVLGAMTLVAGTTVGAGILALPATTAPAGFGASAVALTGGAGYAIVTGLLLAEVNLNTVCELGAGGVSIVSMASRTLGTTGTRLASGAYLFLHYCLLVAYFSRGGEALQGLTNAPLWASSAMFAAAFGGLCYFSSARVLDIVNGILFGGVLVSFGALTAGAISDVDPSALAEANWSAVPATLPVVSLAFVYQNVVPVIVSNLEGDTGKIRQAIVGGVLVPLVMFLAWEAAILGNTSGLSISPGMDPVSALQDLKPGLSPFVDAFSFLAVATSTIGFVLGLSDFVADGLQLKAGRQQPIPYLVTLVPPYILAMAYPDVFFDALDAAGTYGVLVLFGLMPAAMVWAERYSDVLPPEAAIRVVQGGKLPLLAVGGAAGAVILHSIFTTVLPHASP